MASNVFGTPITKEYLREMGEGRESSKKDRARVALQMKNEDGKDVSARAFVESLAARFGDNICCLCLIYNATGDPLTFYANHNWTGRICESPYPVIIQNGQWGAFLHGQYYGGDKESKAAVVYSGNNSQGEHCYWVVCFLSSTRGDSNEVYTEVCKPSDYNLHSKVSADWNSLERELTSNSGKTVYMAEQNGGLMFGAIGNIATSFFEAILTLPEALN